MPTNLLFASLSIPALRLTYRRFPATEAHDWPSTFKQFSEIGRLFPFELRFSLSVPLSISVTASTA
jgi:hypothetical protein